MADRIDRIVEAVKWPAAVVAVILLLPSAVALVKLVISVAMSPVTMFAFLLGATAYSLLWWNHFRPRQMTVAQTLEHEVTHCIFAVVTGHRVTAVEAKSDGRGGLTRYEGGRGNWLITISPYFFPTSCLILILPLTLAHPPITTIGNGLLGAAFALHVTSTFRETHPGQTDLKRVGYPFAWAFLPTANIVSTGLILAFACDGWDGMYAFVCDVFGRLKTVFA